MAPRQITNSFTPVKLIEFKRNRKQPFKPVLVTLHKVGSSNANNT